MNCIHMATHAPVAVPWPTTAWAIRSRPWNIFVGQSLWSRTICSICSFWSRWKTVALFIGRGPDSSGASGWRERLAQAFAHFICSSYSAAAAFTAAKKNKIPFIGEFQYRNHLPKTLSFRGCDSSRGNLPEPRTFFGKVVKIGQIRRLSLSNLRKSR